MGQDVLVKAEDLEIEEDGDGVEGDGAEDGPGAYDRCAAKVLTGRITNLCTPTPQYCSIDDIATDGAAPAAAAGASAEIESGVVTLAAPEKKCSDNCVLL